MGWLRRLIKGFFLNFCFFWLMIIKVGEKSIESEFNDVKWEFDEGKFEKKGLVIFLMELLVYLLVINLLC